MPAMTPDGLVTAIKSVLELNNYDVAGPLQVHGAEIDLKARLRGDPFAAPLYIEATIEHVDNDKYGKDVGKFALIREKEPDAQRLIVSATGFSLPVKERAKESRIHTLTYSELFARFEQFGSYVRSVLTEGQRAKELAFLDSVYEEPRFSDVSGHHVATEYLDQWRNSSASDSKWLVIVGEYGTGKTALTRVLQYRWTKRYFEDPRSPIPFRIELRDFTRQFDARGLLHHFLDRNHLDHISVAFVQELIRSGRVLLLLDGYDEMAQHMHARERRACLEALAELAQGGTRGLLTSRPNYFSEAEELQVFEALYDSLSHRKYFLNSIDQQLVEHEMRVDQLLEQFLVPNERRLEDLTPEQTEALVARTLGHDPEGRDAVLNILRRVFRESAGDSRSLAGKPVIVTYLLEIVEGLKESGTSAVEEQGGLTEWQAYKLIVDQLMLRDYKRSPDILPDVRRRFLHRLSAALSRRSASSAAEDLTKDLASQLFARDLSRVSGQARHDLLETLAIDLRSSATLTAYTVGKAYYYRFSHNSLREYLLAEFLLDQLAAGSPLDERPVVSDAMRTFAASLSAQQIRTVASQLAQRWVNRAQETGVGAILTLVWDALMKLHANSADASRESLQLITGDPAGLNDVEIERIVISSGDHPADLQRASFENSALLSVTLATADLRNASFRSTILDAVDLTDSDLRNACFDGAALWEVVISGADLRDAQFTNMRETDVTVLTDLTNEAGEHRRLSGAEAFAYLTFRGALTPPVSPSLVCAFHANFPIADKIIEKLAEQTYRQRRGLEQRGAAQADHVFAREFLQELERSEWVYAPHGRNEQIGATPKGREVFQRFKQTRELPEQLAKFILAY